MLHHDVAKMMQCISPAEMQAYVEMAGEHEVVIIESTIKPCRWKRSFEHNGLKTLYLGTSKGFEKWKKEHEKGKEVKEVRKV
jgi:hypothetical protein